MDFKIDLDAARRERVQPDGLPLLFGGEDFVLPAELPLEVFDPFLDKDFNLAGLIREVVAKHKAVGLATAITDTLFDRPDLPLDVVERIFKAFELLFGVEQYERFKSHKPSLPDYGALLGGLVDVYGVGLGEAFSSLSSFETGGETPQQTSDASTASTSVTPSGASHEVLSMEEEMRMLEGLGGGAPAPGESVSATSTS